MGQMTPHLRQAERIGQILREVNNHLVIARNAIAIAQTYADGSVERDWLELQTDPIQASIDLAKEDLMRVVDTIEREGWYGTED